MGDAQLAAHAIATKVWTLLAFALDAIAIAGQAITGRTLGAGDVAAHPGRHPADGRWGVGRGVVFGVLVVAARPLAARPVRRRSTVTGSCSAVLWLVALLQPIAAWCSCSTGC